MKDKKEIEVFIASPRDVTEERDIVRDVCEDINKSPLLKPFGISFQAVGWEDAFPSPGRPQEILNRLVDKSNIFVCIFHKKFGSSTGKEESGTLEEFLNAYDSWKTFRKPHIMFYFRNVGIGSLDDLDDPQLRKVLDLKKKIVNENLLLYGEFSTPDEFREKIKEHLEKWTVENSKGWEKVGDKIEKAFEEDKVFKEYLKSALHDNRHLQTQGFETNLRIPIELERVYINMKARIHSREFGLTIADRNKMEERAREERLTSLDIKAAFGASGRHNVKDMVILGDPGSGKTTLLKYILVMLIEGRGRERLGVEENIIPFFAPLRNLKDPDKETFTGFFTRVCAFKEYSITEGAFKKLLDGENGIILLDGLDEVADEDARIKTCQWIDRAKKRFAKTMFIITSRYSGYLDRSRLKGPVLELSIQKFTPDEVREFLVKWFEAVEAALHLSEDEAKWRKKGREDALVLVERINKSEHISRLAVNPLLLQIIALVHRDRGTLPQRRVELYEECTNVLLEKWDMAKGLDSLLTAREARQVLQPLALWLHEVDERRSAPIEDIIRVIKGPLEEIGKSDINPKGLLLNIRDRSGIFMGYSESEYGFTHLSFQEYLSAEQIRNKREFRILLSNYGNRWWKETILLSLALDNPSIIEEFMERIIPTDNFLSEISIVTDVVNDSVCKPSKPFITAVKNKDLRPEAGYNAIRILKEIGGGRVLNTLKEAVENKDKKLALLAFEALVSLGAAEGVASPITEELPETYENPVDASKMVLVPAGTFIYGSKEDDPDAHSDEKPQRVIDLPAFYIDIFPVTNKQFCRFLNEKMPDEDTLNGWIRLKGEFRKERCRIRQDSNGYEVEKGYLNHPVIYAAWYGADEYAKWAGKRLPTEEEWEKAARGPDGRVYPWGENFDKSLCNSDESGIGMATGVNKYPKGKSYYGCYGMAGNVWEWTSSYYDKDGDSYVLRGGSWINGSDYCRCAYRGRIGPDYSINDVGFRCARTGG